jgi:hypothetical protein
MHEVPGQGGERWISASRRSSKSTFVRVQSTKVDSGVDHRAD